MLKFSVEYLSVVMSASLENNWTLGDLLRLS